MPRFMLPEEPGELGLARIVGDDAHHLAGPLRCRVGDTVELCRPGRWLAGDVVAVARDAIELRVTRDEPSPPEPAGPTLYAALTAREAWERTLGLATEFGVQEVWPLRTVRAAPMREGRAEERSARWSRVCEEARKLTGRTRCPSLVAPSRLAEALARLRSPLLVLDAAGEPVGSMPAEWLARAALLVGPEGGLTADELAAAMQQGGRVGSLGPYTLRAESAVAAGLAVLACARSRFPV